MCCNRRFSYSSTATTFLRANVERSLRIVGSRHTHVSTLVVRSTQIHHDGFPSTYEDESLVHLCDRLLLLFRFRWKVVFSYSSSNGARWITRQPDHRGRESYRPSRRTDDGSMDTLEAHGSDNFGSGPGTTSYPFPLVGRRGGSIPIGVSRVHHEHYWWFETVTSGRTLGPD